MVGDDSELIAKITTSFPMAFAFALGLARTSASSDGGRLAPLMVSLALSKYSAILARRAQTANIELMVYVPMANSDRAFDVSASM